MNSNSEIPLLMIDAFADGPFSGNPAAVCLLDQWPSDRWLQGVAAELNQSETAYLVRRMDSYELRWFTPTVEVDLCGHATLAAAFVLWQLGKADADRPIRFSTRSGTLLAVSRGSSIELDFPLEMQDEVAAPDGLLEALGVAALYVGRSRFDYLVEVGSELEVANMAPDLTRLARVDCRGTIVTARSSDGRYDFVSRFFAPAAGIDEDPVTGSAHATLAHFWQERLGKSEFQARQISKRGGVLGVGIRGQRVLLSGRAVLFSRGILCFGTDR